MKTRIAILLLLIFTANVSFGIGLPHSYAKKKKVERPEIIKKENRLDKKIVLQSQKVITILVLEILRPIFSK